MWRCMCVSVCVHMCDYVQGCVHAWLAIKVCGWVRVHICVYVCLVKGQAWQHGYKRVGCDQSLLHHLLAYSLTHSPAQSQAGPGGSLAVCQHGGGGAERWIPGNVIDEGHKCCLIAVKRKLKKQTAAETAITQPWMDHCIWPVNTVSVGLTPALAFWTNCLSFLVFCFFLPLPQKSLYSSVSTILPNKWFWSSFITLLYSCLTNPLENVPVS